MTEERAESAESTPQSTSRENKGDRVTVTIDAYILKEYPDGSALVDADGKEILVAEDEYQ